MNGIYKALAAAYKEVREVQMQRSAGVNYAYVGNEGLIEAIRPAFEKHEIVMYPAGIEDVRHEEYQTSGNPPKTMHRTTFTAKYVFAHSDGSFIETSVRAESADTSDKSTAQAMTMAAKTALRQTMMVSGDKDPDSGRQDMGTRRNTSQRPQDAAPAPKENGAAPKDEWTQFVAAFKAEGFAFSDVAKFIGAETMNQVNVNGFLVQKGLSDYAALLSAMITKRANANV